MTDLDFGFGDYEDSICTEPRTVFSGIEKYEEPVIPVTKEPLRLFKGGPPVPPKPDLRGDLKVDAFTDACEDLNLQSEAERLASSLEPWKALVYVAHDLLIWKNPLFAHLLLGSSIAKFLLTLYLDWSVFTLVCLSAVSFLILDIYLPKVGPALLNAVSGVKAWTSKQDQEFLAICEKMVTAKSAASSVWQWLRDIRYGSPYIYSLLVVMCSICTAYTGTLFGGLFAFWFSATVMVMVPGLLHHGIIQKNCGKFFKEAKIIAEKLIVKPKDE